MSNNLASTTVIWAAGSLAALGLVIGLANPNIANAKRDFTRDIARTAGVASGGGLNLAAAVKPAL